MSVLTMYLLLAAIILLLPTAYAAKSAAPFVPARKKAIEKALTEIKLGQGDTLVDLGAGSGTVLIEAAALGANAIGYELSPIMYVFAWLYTRTHQNITILFKNFYKQALPPQTTHVYAFWVPDTMPRLKQFLATQHLPNAKYLLVYMFPFKDLPAGRQVAPKIIKTVTTPTSGTVYVYDLTKLTKQA